MGPGAYEVIRKFFEEVVSKRWKTVGGAVVADGKIHNFAAWDRSHNVRPYQFRKGVESHMKVYDHETRKMLDADYVAAVTGTSDFTLWTWGEYFERADLRGKVALYELRTGLKANPTDSAVFKEFERFLVEECGIALREVRSLEEVRQARQAPAPEAPVAPPPVEEVEAAPRLELKYVGPRLAELVAISRLDPEVAKKYRNLDAEFEERVWEVFRLLGFEVEELGHRRPGERVPDGIARHGNFSVVFDCKATSGAYKLSASDERAAKEYVRRYKKRYVSLAFLLIAPDFSGDVEARLEDISAELGVPTAHIATADLLYLLDKFLELRARGEEVDAEAVRKAFFLGRGERLTREEIDERLAAG